MNGRIYMGGVRWSWKGKFNGGMIQIYLEISQNNIECILG